MVNMGAVGEYDHANEVSADLRQSWREAFSHHWMSEVGGDGARVRCFLMRSPGLLRHNALLVFSAYGIVISGDMSFNGRYGQSVSAPGYTLSWFLQSFNHDYLGEAFLRNRYIKEHVVAQLQHTVAELAGDGLTAAAATLEQLVASVGDCCLCAVESELDQLEDRFGVSVPRPRLTRSEGEALCLLGIQDRFRELFAQGGFNIV